MGRDTRNDGISRMTNPLRLVKRPSGQIFCTGLFAMHDTFGFPLACSLHECRLRGWIPCVRQFVADAICSGWERAKAEVVVADAVAEDELWARLTR